MSWEFDESGASKAAPEDLTSEALFADTLRSSRMPFGDEPTAGEPARRPSDTARESPKAEEPVYNASPERLKAAKELADTLGKTNKLNDDVIKALTAPTPDKQPHMSVLINQALKKNGTKLSVEQTVEALDGDFGIWAKLLDDKKVIDKRKI